MRNLRYLKEKKLYIRKLILINKKRKSLRVNYIMTISLMKKNKMDRLVKRHLMRKKRRRMKIIWHLLSLDQMIIIIRIKIHKK